MNDTSPVMEKKWRDLMMARSPSERMSMCMSMLASAKQLVKAGILTKNPQLSPKELSREVFLRFYRDDYCPEAREKIIEGILQGLK